jgi:iron complex outermembrane receptor protein
MRCRYKKPGVVFGVALCVQLAATCAPAQPPEIKAPEPAGITAEELMKLEIPTVEAASKYEQKITEAPSSVTVINSDEVKKYGCRTLADILRSAPGLYVSYDRNYSFLGVRGFELGDFYTRNDRFLLLVDGHRINNSLTDGASLGTEFILDVDLIDRVEIIRGPGSSLYGNNAFFGVINVVTRRGRDLTGHGAEVSGEVASFDTYKGRATYGNKLKNGLELLLSGTFYASEGHDRLYYREFDQRVNPANLFARHNGVARNADNDDFKSFFGSVGFHGFSLEGGLITREKRNPTAQFNTQFDDNRFRTTDDRSYVNFKYDREFPEVLHFTAQAYYDRQDTDIIEPFPTFSVPPVFLFKDAQIGEWAGGEGQLTKRLWDRLTLTLGGEYRNDFHQEENFLNAETGARTSPAVQRDRQNHGIYLQGDFAVLTNLHFSGGFRYDQYADFDPAFNPRVAVIYNPIGQAVLKFIPYSTAFRAPNFFELNTNPQLNPETITSHELIYEQGLGDHLRSSAALFWNDVDDKIVFDSQGTPRKYKNLSSAEAKGAELALDGFWAGGLRGRASYSYQTIEDNSTHEVLTDSPEHLAKLNLSAPLLKDKLFAGLEFLFVSRRTTTHLTPSGSAEPGPDAAGYGFINLTLFSQNLIKGLDLSASVYNLLDKAYGDPATPFHQQAIIAQDGRTFRVKLTYRF